MESKADTDALVSSSTWLQSHGLRKTKLTLLKILAQLGFEHKEEYVNKLGRPVSSRYAHGLFHQYNNDGKIYNLTAKREHVLQKIESVTGVIELFKQRLIWLTGGSQVLFGVIQEQSVAFVIDVNSLYEAQDDLCREAFCLALNEQVARISKFNLVWASEIPVKWQRKPVSASYQTVEAATQWVWNQPYSPSDSADCAAEALSLAVNDQVEAIYYISAGDIPDDKKLLMSQRISNSQFPIHVVSFNPLKQETITFWKELSHRSHGRFHVYSVENKHKVTKTTKEEYFESNPVMEKVLPECDLKEDEQLILDELKEAQSILEKLKDILKTFYDSENENSSQPTQEENPEDCISSKIWLQKYGLKAKKLQFYDALADCAFRHIDGVVDIKTKPEDESIQTDAENQMKLINAKYCDRFVHALWKDGSVVHVFVSKEKCRWYEERMRSTLELMERRLKWLQNGSRELFGTILEDQIYILIDTSHSMKDKMFLVKEKIFQLMQEQLKYKQMFNFIKFDSKAEAWKTKLADVNENSLKEAWLWVKELQVGISTNTLEALQIALRDRNTQAVYLLTDGRPDQPSTTILRQMNLLNRVPIHTISFNCDDTEANGFLHQLSSKTGGRFHSYSSDLENPDAPQPFVSEDIQLLLNEIEMGKSDLEKMQKVHTECLLLDIYHNGEKDHSHVSRPYKIYNQKLLAGPQSACECATTSPLLHTPRPNLLQRNKAHHAAQTRSSLLRALSNGVKFGENLTNADMPLERKDLFLRNDLKAAAVIKDFKMADDATPQKKVRRLPKDNLDISSAHWLKKRGLVARKLTIMDVLAPTTVPHTAKYVPILDKHVLSKVFDEALPLAHVSGSKKLITLINPQAVNLQEYKRKLAQAIDYYERRLNLVIWRALSQEERDRFESDAPVPYLENKEALLQALDRLGWPIPIDDVMLLEEEIETGKGYLQQASDLQDTSKNDALAASLQKPKNKEENKNHDTKMEQRKKAIDTLKNQKVIARSDVDGFYYQGSVVRSISKKHALVDFCQGENQIIPITFIIPTGGAVPNPPLKVGDFVFSKTSTGSGCYVPAVVIATPRTEAADKLYSVLKYNNRKEQCVRRQLIKISPSQFAFSCRYIRKAQMVDYTISNVQFVNPVKSSTFSEDKKHKKRKKERSHGKSEEKNVITVKPDEPNKDLYLQNDITEEAPKPRDTAVEEKLKNLAFQVSQYQKEQSEHQQAIEQYLKELAVLKSHQDECPTEKAQKDVAKQQIDLLQQLKKLTPISSVHRKNAISNDRSPINQPDEDKKYDCPLLPGQKILALCPYNGWYEEGSIVHDCGDYSYFIQMSHGELSRIWREDLYSDADDYKQDIQERDPVIAPHPVFTEAYCPGVVLKVMTDLKLLVQYYDHTENLVPREQVYSTTQERFERDTANIMACEQRWVGQAVVARDDETGAFHLAEVRKRVGSGRQYVICWMDGTTVTQDIKWIFGRFSKPHVINVGSHVLTLASPSTLTFLPGVIPEITGTKLHVNFCNGQSCENVESHLCFGLSESRFKDAIEYYWQQNQEQDAHGEDTVSEDEDSHSDISSITITSIDSEAESNE